MDDDDAAGAVAVRMGVLFSGTAVRGPARVADAEGAIERILAQNLFKVRQLSCRAAQIELVAAGVADGDASRVVAAIFEAPQPLDDDWDDFLWSDVADDAAHASILCEPRQGGCGTNRGVNRAIRLQPS